MPLRLGCTTRTTCACQASVCSVQNFAGFVLSLSDIIGSAFLKRVASMMCPARVPLADTRRNPQAAALSRGCFHKSMKSQITDFFRLLLFLFFIFLLLLFVYVLFIINSYVCSSISFFIFLFTFLVWLLSCWDSSVKPFNIQNYKDGIR